MRRLLFLLLVLQFLFIGVGSAFAAQTIFTGAQDFYIDIYSVPSDVGSNTGEIFRLNSKDLDSSSFSKSYTYSYSQNNVLAKQAITYPMNNEDYLPRPRGLDLAQSTSYVLEFFRYPQSPFASNYQCNPTIVSFDSTQKRLNVQSNLAQFKVWSGHTGPWALYKADISQLSTGDLDHYEARMKAYYYMKTEVKAELYKNGVLVTAQSPIYPTNKIGTSTDGTYNNYILLKPSSNSFDLPLLSEAEILANYGNGNYKWVISVTPIDRKCTGATGFNQPVIIEQDLGLLQQGCFIQQSFNSDNTIQATAPSLEFDAFPFLRLVKTDLSGAYSEVFVLPTNLERDTNNKLLLKTNLPYELTNDYSDFGIKFKNKIQNQDQTSLDKTIYFGGLKDNYSELSQDGDIFPGYSFNWEEDLPYVRLTNTQKTLDYDLNGVKEALEEEGQDFGDYSLESYIIPVDPYKCTQNEPSSFEEETVNTFSIQLKNPNLAELEVQNELRVIECSGDVSISNNQFSISGSGGYLVSMSENPITTSSDYGVIASSSQVLLDGYPNYYNLNTIDWIGQNLDNKIIYVAGWNGHSDPDDDYDYKGQCKVSYVNGYEFFDDENFNKAVCTLDKTECQLIDTNEELTLPTIEDKANIKIYKEGINIRNESPNPVTIALKGHKIKKYKSKEQANSFIEDTVRLMEKFEIEKHINYDQTNDETKIRIDLHNFPVGQKDITLYQIIPKEFASRLSEIQITENAGQFIVLDKDPVIGWYFNDSESNESVEYILPGDNEGGTIIITQEPILFNEGELVINYRETSCNADELELFQLDDLENSKLYKPGSGRLYKVCIAHVNDTISTNMKLDTNDNAVHIFNYTDGANMSITGQATIGLDMSTNIPDIYWNVQFSQDNPDGTFSCLGSYNSQQSSTFGDCGYQPNRIWLHLGEDMEPPTTKISYPYLAHTMKITLDAVDLGSGVKNTYYCIEEEDGENCQPKLYNNKEIFLSCDTAWGCVKSLRYYSEDNHGNQEPLQTYKLTLIEKGSACQADCTAKPTPNRIIKDCMNLNSCKFYGVTDSEQRNVAEACHFLTADTWVTNPNNPDEEILCPNGPTRPAQFTAKPIQFWNSVCDNLQQASYPVIIDGKQVNMVFVYCEEY